MHAEAAHTLLGIVKHSLSEQNIEENLHLIYALVYHQMDLMKLCKNIKLYHPRETERIQGVTQKASALIQEEGARTAPKALKVLEDKMDELKEAARMADMKSPSKRKKQNSSPSDDEDFTFSYEEETDPEIFFVPYLWEVIVCVVTSGTMDWKKDDIQVFALLDEVEHDDEDPTLDSSGVEGLDINVNVVGAFAKNADELV